MSLGWSQERPTGPTHLFALPSTTTARTKPFVSLPQAASISPLGSGGVSGGSGPRPVRDHPLGGVPGF